MTRRRGTRRKPAGQLLLANELCDLMARFRRDELDQEQTLARNTSTGLRQAA